MRCDLTVTTSLYAHTHSRTCSKHTLPASCTTESSPSCPCAFSCDTCDLEDWLKHSKRVTPSCSRERQLQRLLYRLAGTWMLAQPTTAPECAEQAIGPVRDNSPGWSADERTTPYSAPREFPPQREPPALIALPACVPHCLCVATVTRQ